MDKRSRILIVEDDPTMLYALSRIVESVGHEVLEASSGEECLRLARQERPDMILLDVILPDMSGIEVCKRIKSELGGTLVIHLSGVQTTPDNQADGLYAGADGYMTKPVHNRALLAHIQALLRIKEAEAELKKAKDELEQKVTERTLELEELNKALLDDIEKRRQAEDGLRQAAERLEEQADDLSRSNTELELFARVVSHDLQEPLRMVSSFVQLLQKRYKGKLDASADEYIEHAVDGAIRMQELINDLLTYSRVGSQKKNFSDVNMDEVFNNTLANLQIAIVESGASITHDPLPTVGGNQMILGQLLQNLIENALKFRSENPPRIHVSAEEKEREWVFSVSDNGIGIDPKYAQRIFAIFQRLHGRKDYPGTGIGLAISKKIVEHHGGRIWVESRSGNGSTFYFTIPIIKR